ncbi:uncharacterized protein BDV17DRAFT_293322 [Aspergillus undulatus]|uniref:uncharacterized protein n=1 Tax=Aspergillus undulatus TaxID=1810928 RepID=UPI003CCCA455
MSEVDTRAFQRATERVFKSVEHSAALANEEGKNLMAQVDPAHLINPAALRWAGKAKILEILCEKETWGILANHAQVQDHGSLVVSTPISVSEYADPSATNSTEQALETSSWTDRHNQSLLPDSYPRRWGMVVIFSSPVSSSRTVYRDLIALKKERRIESDIVDPLFELTATFQWLAALHGWCTLKAKADSTCAPIIGNVDYRMD